MPILALPSSPHDGIRVQALIALGRPEVVRLRRAKMPIPQPITVTAILDTGAERTCIDPSIVRRLNLPVSGQGFVASPGVGVGPAIFGGATFGFTYEAGLVILHPVTKPPSNLVIHELEVDELPLQSFGIEAVIGRDVLASCVLVYNGTAGSATLAY
jgi:hypothetical protein